MSFLERVDQTIRRSPVWRSIFRQPVPRRRAVARVRGDEQRVPAPPPGARPPARGQVRLHVLPRRAVSFFLFLVLTVTGVYLMFFYVPSATQAYTNILDIQSEVTFGLLTRNIHRWAAHLMVFFVFLHMMRVFYHGAYKPPREFNWVVGVVLLFLTIMLSLHGLPAAVGPDRLLGDHHRHEHGRLRAAVQHARPSCCCSAASRSARTRCCASTCCTSWSCRSSPPSSSRSTSGGSARTAASAARSEREADDDRHRDQDAARGARRPARRSRRGAPEIDKQRVPMSARPYRLLALVKQDAVVRVQKEPDDTVMTWPHLLSIEFLAAGDDEHLPAADGPVHQRPARGAGQRQRHAGRGQGAVVLPRPPGAAGLLPPDRRRRARPDVRAGGRRPDPVRRPRQHPRHPALASARPPWCCSRCSAASACSLTFVGIFFRGPGYSFVIPYLTFFAISTPAFTSPCDASEGSPSRMSNYHVEPADKPAGPDEGGHQVAAPASRSRGSRAAQLLRRSLGGGIGAVAARGHGRDASASCGRT